MLKLSRRNGEKLIIGTDVVVTICKCHGNRVEIGIDAPPHIRIDRAECKAIDETGMTAMEKFVALYKNTKRSMGS